MSWLLANSLLSCDAGLGGWCAGMRGAGWIRGLMEADARDLRSEISRLQIDLIAAANSQGKSRLHDVAHTLRCQKARLERLEECLASMTSNVRPETSATPPHEGRP